MQPTMPVRHTGIRGIDPFKTLHAITPAGKAYRSRAVSPGAVFWTGTARFLSAENGGYIDLADAATWGRGRKVRSQMKANLEGAAVRK